MICRILFVVVLLCVVRVRAAEQPFELNADDVSGTFEGIMEAKGNARLRGEGVLLTADEIRYEHQKGTVTAVGRIVFTRENVRLLADRLVYNRQDGSFAADNIRLGSHPYFIEGFSASGTRDEITVKGARASFGEPGRWQPTINADTIVYSPGKQFRSENVTVGIGATQPVPIPRFNHNLRAPFAATASLNGGYRRSLGVFAETSAHVPVHPSVRLGADLGVYTNRGIMIGPSGRYEKPENPAEFRGYFKSGYINDHGEKGIDLLGRPIPEDRAYAEWQHEQQLSPDLRLAAQLNWWKDSEVVRDFRSRAFFPVQEPDTFLESIYSGPNYFVSLFGRFQPNRFHRVQERLPEVRFDLLPLALGHGFYHRFNASAAVLREDPPDGSPTLRSDRLDGYYTLMRPIAPTEWFAITPMVGGRATYYTNMKGVARTGNYTRLLGEVGADAVLRASGTFDYKNPQWKIEGLRHLLTPRLSYRYIPERDRGVRIPQIDRRVRIDGVGDYLPYLQPLGLGDARNIDDLGATNTLRLGIDNILQTRDPIEGTRDLVVLNVGNDFRFKRRPGERDVSEIHTELALMPARWLQVDVYQSFSPHSMSLREFNSGITVRDGTLWSARIGNNFLRGEIQDYSIDGRVRINERFEGLTRLHYDARKHRFNEQTYGIAQNLGNTWIVSYTVRLYSGRVRESNFGFNIEIEAIRF